MEDVSFMLILTLGWVACLRWDDLSDCKFNVKIFLISTKTDNYKEGQRCIILTSELPHSSYQLLVLVLTYLAVSPAVQRSGIPLTEIPLCFKYATVGGIQVPDQTCRLTCYKFSKKLKLWC